MGPVLIVLADDLDRGVPGVVDDPAVGEALLGATLDLARQVGGARMLLFHPPELEPQLTPRSLGFRLWPADGDTPARRYANAFRQAEELGYEGALVIGLDVPQLGAERLTEAADLLAQHQAVLVPGDDGSVAVLGLQRDEPHLFPDDAVPDAETIRTRARQQRVRLHELAPHDRLTPERLDDFLASPP